MGLICSVDLIRNELSAQLIDSLGKFFDDCHKRFGNAIKCDEELVNRALEMNDEKRRGIIKCAPQISHLYMQLYYIISSYKYVLALKLPVFVPKS